MKKYPAISYGRNTLQKMKGRFFVQSSKKNTQIIEMRKNNAKSVLKKVVIGILVILMVGVIAYALLFIVMIIM